VLVGHRCGGARDLGLLRSEEADEDVEERRTADRLGHERLDASSIGVGAQFLASESRHHHQARLLREDLRADAARSLDTVEPGHLPVEQHDVERMIGVRLPDRLERLFSGGDRRDAQAESAQQLAENLARRRIVVHDQRARAVQRRLAGARRRAGSSRPISSQAVKPNVLPTPGSESTQTVPPISSTRRRVMASPEAGAAVLASG
jgi:hypothetical protein